GTVPDTTLLAKLSQRRLLGALPATHRIRCRRTGTETNLQFAKPNWSIVERPVDCAGQTPCREGEAPARNNVPPEIDRGGTRRVPYRGPHQCAARVHRLQCVVSHPG